MANPIYASGEFIVVWNGLDLSAGWGDDTFMTITPNGALKQMDIGADGNASVSKLADQGGVITMTFKQTSKILEELNKGVLAELSLELLQSPFSGVMLFTDPSGSCDDFLAYNTVLVDHGSIEHQKVMGERTYTWNCEKLLYGNYADILPKIASYIKKSSSITEALENAI